MEDYQDAPDSTLVAALQQEDAAAFEYFVRTFGGRALAVARRYLRNSDDAEDCIQDAFLQAFRNIEKFEQRSSLATWLHRIVVNSALMKLRSQTRLAEQSIDDLLPQFDTGECRVEPSWRFDESVETLAAKGEARRHVRDAIDSLPENYRIVLLLRDIEGYRTDETAELMDMTPGSVKITLHRARSALKKKLEPLFERDGE
ncbi:MAG: sigma-70 family RNA polymerase sigma factor [Rhodospirillaceae bacterium]|jgi:RNA polymerase sigma-70 factor, ECF subfamily|nr:sigma-70 family RNA polymerase sigma factor [Rhodospirillaceae bacterium]